MGTPIRRPSSAGFWRCAPCCGGVGSIRRCAGGSPSRETSVRGWRFSVRHH